MKNEAFCRWYEKPLRDVTEVQQEQCEENGQQSRRYTPEDWQRSP